MANSGGSPFFVQNVRLISAVKANFLSSLHNRLKKIREKKKGKCIKCISFGRQSLGFCTPAVTALNHQIAIRLSDEKEFCSHQPFLTTIRFHYFPSPCLQQLHLPSQKKMDFKSSNKRVRLLAKKKKLSNFFFVNKLTQLRYIARSALHTRSAVQFVLVLLSLA